jgi:hypothetical protein
MRLCPGGAPWLAAVRNELTAFPSGRHDDQVNALSQFQDWIEMRRGVSRTQHGGALVRREIRRREVVRQPGMRRLC